MGVFFGAVAAFRYGAVKQKSFVLIVIAFSKQLCLKYLLYSTRVSDKSIR